MYLVEKKAILYEKAKALWLVSNNKQGENMGKITTKKDKVLNHLETYGTITPLEAMEKYNSMRLSAIIFDLKQEGPSITTDIMRNKKTKSNYAVYSIKRS